MQVPPIRIAVLTSILLAGSARALSGQAGVIRGQVVRADQPVGLADVDVLMQPPGVRTRSDLRGAFEFRDLAPGRVELTLTRAGFVAAVVVIEVDERTTAELSIPLEPVVGMLDPIVASASRDERSLSEVAVAASVADTSALRRGRTVGLHETLRMMPGVQATSRFGTEDLTIGIRGSAARPVGRGVAVLLDGIPITESDGRTLFDFIEPATLRQVEVVRGPASALYGGSVGGVVNAVSRSARNSPGVSASGRVGAFGFQKYEAQAGKTFANERASGFVAGSYTRADGYRAHSDRDITRAQVALDYIAGPGTRLALEAGGSRRDLRLPGSVTEPQFDADPDTTSPTATAFGTQRADNRFRAGVRVQQALGAGEANAYFFRGGRTMLFAYGPGVVDGNFHRVQAGGRFRSGLIARTPLRATAGVDYDHLTYSDRRWQNDGGVPAPPLQDDGRGSVPNLGIYTQLEWRPAPLLDVTIGLRYDWIEYAFESFMADRIPRQKTSFNQLSPRLSALWNPLDATSVYASIGRGFDTPIIVEVSASPGDSLSRVRPKSLWNYELGARRVVSDRVRLEASLFYADVRGEFVPINADGLLRTENASRSRNSGVELGMTARATERVELAATYTFLDLRLREFRSSVLDSTGTLQEVDFAGKRLPAVPGHRAIGEVSIRPWATLDLGVQVEWQSTMYVETGNADRGTWYFRLPDGQVGQVPFRAVPARALVHLNAASRFGPATLFASIENLFGLRYVGTVLANESLGGFYEAGPPFSLALGLRVTGWATGL